MGRFAAAAAALTAAAAHVLATGDTWRAATYLGVCFVLFEWACVLLAWRLATADTARVWLACGICGTVAPGVYLWSRLVGLPAFPDDLARRTEPLGLVAVAAEVAMVALATHALTASSAGPAKTETQTETETETQAATGQADRRPGVAGTLALQLGGFALVAATFSGGSLPSGTALRAASHPHGAPVPGSAPSPGSAGSSGSTGSGYRSAVGGHPAGAGGFVRTYYIGADEVAWDYAPVGPSEVTGRPPSGTAQVVAKPGPGRTGPRAVKCLYRGYTDTSFRTVKPHPGSDTYLDLVGPVIRAAVGDTITVVFRNSCRIPANVQPHEVFGATSSQGTPPAGSTSGRDAADDTVPRGGRHIYSWKVPERAGPGPRDGTAVMWMYYSTGEVRDTYAALTGLLEVTARGTQAGT